MDHILGWIKTHKAWLFVIAVILYCLVVIIGGEYKKSHSYVYLEFKVVQGTGTNVTVTPYYSINGISWTTGTTFVNF
jgi:hypothetical protein